VDYDDAFAPVARMESVKVLLALATQEGWRVHHMDVKLAFLNGDLKEEVYVQQPPPLLEKKGRSTSFARLCTVCGRLRTPGTPS
jgi:hypothetical protein